MDTIAERIIQAILVKLGEIRTIYDYALDLGATVKRAASFIDEAELPALNVFPRAETSELEYGRQINTMPIDIKALIALEESNPSVLAEQAKGDIISNILGTEQMLAFNDGNHEIRPGDIVTGDLSRATARIIDVAVMSGTWAGGTASGYLRFRNQTGKFQSEYLKVGDHLGVATISGDVIPISGQEIAGGGLTRAIRYMGGGIDAYPMTEDIHVEVRITFGIVYETLLGNPYEQ